MSENEKQSAVSPQYSVLSTQYSALCAPGALEALRERLGPRARLGERLAPHTSYRIGGPADLFLPASRTEQVVEALQAAHAQGVPCRVIGGASNLLVAWESGSGMKAQVRSATDGSVVSEELTIEANDHRYQDFKAYPDGSVAYPARGDSDQTVTIARVLPCAD